MEPLRQRGMDGYRACNNKLLEQGDKIVALDVES